MITELWNITDNVILDFRKEILAFVKEQKGEGSKEKAEDGSNGEKESNENQKLNAWEKEIEKKLSSYIAGIVRSKLEARVNSTVTIVGNRLVSSAVQTQLEKSRASYYGKIQAGFEELQKKEREGHKLSESEINLKTKYEQKINDFSQAWDVEQNSKSRVSEIEEGGKIGLPELQGLANEDGTTIIFENANGETKELVPKDGNTSGKVVRLKESESGHVVPADSSNYHDGSVNDQNCVLRAFLFAKDGTMPAEGAVGQLRHTIAGIAAKDPSMQLHNFIWRDQPALLARCGRAEPRKEATSILGDLFKRRRLGYISKDQMEKCIPSEVEKIYKEYGEDLSPDKLSKILAAKIHPTAEGNAYLENIKGGKEYVFCHMLSEKHAKVLIDKLVTDYHNEVVKIEADSSMSQQEKAAKIKSCSSREAVVGVLRDIACDDLIKQQVNCETHFADEAMKKIDKAVKQKSLSTPERRDLVLESTRTVVGSPGNARIGQKSLNASIAERPDLQQGCEYSARKLQIYEKYPDIIKSEETYRSSSTPANSNPANSSPKRREE